MPQTRLSDLLPWRWRAPAKGALTAVDAEWLRTNSGSKLSDFVDSVLLIALWRMSVAAIAENVSVS